MNSGLLKAIALMGCASFAMTQAPAANAQEQPAYVEFKIVCSFSETHMCSSPNKAPYTFSFMLHNLSGYVVNKVWLLARYNLASSPYRTEPFSKIGVFKKNVKNDDAAIFSFNAETLASKLGLSMDAIRAGVEVKLEIQSVGSGGGRVGSCKIADIKYISSQNTWAWRLDEANSWQQAIPGKFAFFYAGGTVNAVECRFDKFEGATVTDTAAQ